VASFLGISNLLGATVGERDGDYLSVVLTNGASIRIPAALKGDTAQLRIGVRPEKIRLFAEGLAVPDQMNRLEGEVIDASYLGASTSYIIRSRGGERLTVFEQNLARTSHGSLHRPGQQVQVTWSPDHTFAVPGEGIQSIPEAITT